MAETKKKSQYDFGGHKFDTDLYILNLKDNADSFLNSKSSWTPEQKEEWKHSYTNFINALLEDSKNGTGRFSTDEFGTITDRNGEFSNTDSDNYYYNNKGEQISLEDYNNLKAKKLGKYKTFEANRQFASYANLVGKSLRDALAAKGNTSTDDSKFDYAKNGFDAYWQKKYNPAGTLNDLSPYWSKDEKGKYTNRIAETMTDLDDYMSKLEMNDDVRAAYLNYRDVLGQYAPDSKDFNLDKWKNNLVLAANRAGISTWNNGYFNVGSTNSLNTPELKAFNINDDEQALAYANLTDQALAHPELRDMLLALARRKYLQQSLELIDNDKAELKKLLDEANNKIWEQWLANNLSYANVSKRNFGTEVFGNGVTNGNSNFDYASDTSLEAMKRLINALKNGNRKGDILRTSINMTVNGGKLKISNLGEALAYFKPLLDKIKGGWGDFEKVQDLAGNEIYKLKGSENAKGQPLYIWFKNGKAHAYRDDPYSVRRALVISKGLSGLILQTRAEKAAAKEKENQKAINNPKTPHDLKVALTKLLKIGKNPFSDRATFLRTTALATDVGALVASLSGVGAPASAAIGAAATALNLAADMAEGQSFWESLGNNAVGYGMDALSVLPFVRGIAGTGRIIKTASKLAPHIITALGAYSTLKNGEEYIKSWNKMTSNPSLLNRLDWSNIYDSLRLVLSGTTAGTLAIKGNRAMKGAISQDKVKVKTNEGYVTIDKSKLDNIKGAKGLTAQNKALQQATGNSNLKFSAVRNKYRFWKTKDLAKINESEVYDFTKPNTRIINEVEYERPYKWGELGIANHLWQAPKWINNILDRLEVRGLKPTGRIISTPITSTPSTSNRYSISELRQLHNKLAPIVNEYKANMALGSQYLIKLNEFKKARELAKKLRESTTKQTDAYARNNVLQAADALTQKASSLLQELNKIRQDYNKLRAQARLNGNKLTFEVGPNKTKIEVAWNDILKKYGIKYKQGGSILKFNPGGVVNGNPLMSSLQGKKVNNPETDYETAFDTSRVYSIDPTTGLIKDSATVSNKSGNAPLRYQAAEGNTLENTRKIEAHPYYQWLTSLLYNNHLVTDAGTAWQGLTDVNLPENSEASFKDANGNYRASWSNKNNDVYGNPGKSYTTHEDYTNGVRFDGINGARHDVLLNRGTRYYYTDTEGNKLYVKLSDDDKKIYSISKKPTWSGWSKDYHTWWDDYEITGLNSLVNTADEEQLNDPNKNFLLSDILGKIDVTDKWGIPRAMYADNTNRQVTDLLKKQPLLLDPQEDHRYIQSDLNAEMNGQAAAALLNRLASLPVTSDGNLQTAAQLDAVAKGNDAITLGRQLSNLRLREMAEQAWLLEVTNHTNRHNTARTNRQSIYDTANLNKSLEAANLNLKFTVWDALALQKEFKEKSDYEWLRAKVDTFALSDIANTIKYNLGSYAKQYGLTDDDVALWNSVYADGTTKLEDIQKDPNKLRLWNKIMSISKLLLQDLLAEYYGIPRSKYWSIRTSSFSPSANTKLRTNLNGYAKKGAKLNLKKVREAAKGEKLAAALLKAQTADADRFYKTTKDHIDRMYNAIDRLTSYSSKKRKKKKSS